MRKTTLFAASFALAMATPALASTTIFNVDALGNSSTGGTGLATGYSFTVGQTITIASNTNDLWSSGPLPRWSDGSGLIGNRNATALDDSGQPVGSLIGVNFGSYTQNGFTAPFGSLVGRYANGTYQLFGANFSGTAAGSGALDLFYWDSNNGDNTGSIAFALTAAVPEPMTWAMMILGFGVVGGAMRRRKTAVRVAYG